MNREPQPDYKYSSKMVCTSKLRSYAATAEGLVTAFTVPMMWRLNKWKTALFDEARGLSYWCFGCFWF